MVRVTLCVGIEPASSMTPRRRPSLSPMWPRQPDDAAAGADLVQSDGAINRGVNLAGRTSNRRMSNHRL